MTDRDLLDEQMDQRLSAAGARWRDTLPPPAERPSVGAPPRPRWLVPAAAAAAVAAVVTGIYAVGLGDDPAGPEPTDPAEQVVPWKNLPATAPDLSSQRSLYEGVTVGKLGKLPAEPDSTVVFEVTLTSAVDLPLVPCPDYFVHTGATGPDAGRPHGLNCDGVPYRDSQGRPYLPARTPVTFAMRAPTGPAAALTPIFWDLQAPTLPSGAGTLEYSVRSAP